MLVVFAGSCAALLAFVDLRCGPSIGFTASGYDWPGTIALTRGTVLAAGLGVGLMGPLCYSDRIERDRTIGGFGQR